MFWKHDRLKPRNLSGGVPLDVKFKQVKLDGHRLTAFAQQDAKLVALVGRVENVTSKLQYYPWVKALRNLPPISSVDGELHVPGQPASYVPRAIAERDPSLTFTAFAVPRYDREDWRHEGLGKAQTLCESLGVPFAEWELYGGQTVSELEDEARDRKLEGFVLKESNYVGWWRVKPQRTLDGFVIGFRDGKGKYFGQVGSLVVGVRSVAGEVIEVACVSGMDDDVRRAVDPSRDIGRVLEVKFQSVASRRRLQHPRFVRWRDDKHQSECTDAQLEPR